MLYCVLIIEMKNGTIRLGGRRFKIHQKDKYASSKIAHSSERPFFFKTHTFCYKI